MIEILELRALRGPNRYSRNPVIFMVVDIQDYEQKPSNMIAGFTERLVALMPSLHEHQCSLGKPGGFIQRLRSGTWPAHIIEHIALELQCLAKMDVSFGKSVSTQAQGEYIIVFRYLVESAGLYAAQKAVELFEATAQSATFDLIEAITTLKELREADMLGPTTSSIVKEAQSRGIPCIRLNQDSYIQLGYGAHQQRIEASITNRTSSIAVEIADDKTRAKKYLQEAGIPVPYGRVVTTFEEAELVFKEIGAAVVVKPNIGNHGRGSTVDITDIEQLRQAFTTAKAFQTEVIVEEYVSGHDFRFLVIDNKLAAAACREPAHVVGDGVSSIGQLIDLVNHDPRRGFGHEKVLTRIMVDSMTERILSLRGLNLGSIPQKGEKVYLKTTANLSQGGTATDVTDEVNPDLRRMVERAARIIGLDCVGIDALAKDIALPCTNSGIKIVEVNAAPGFRMHLEPTHGTPRNVAKPLVDMLFPHSYTNVPVAAVTGTNGKTTVCKLIAHTLKYAGKKTGLACTTGIAIDGQDILSGDFSGPEGAGIVLRDNTVDHVVLEAARGGIARRGLGVSEIDVGVLLNIGRDHLGTDWIYSREDLSLVKSTVIEVVKPTGSSILNADDHTVMNLTDRARGRIILFSLHEENEELINHLEAGGTVITISSGNAVIRTSNMDINVCAVAEIPITFRGVVDFNTANSLAAIGALHGLGLNVDQIRNGVMTFHPSITQNPGRMNLFDFHDFKVLLDYGHNLESAKALAALLPRLNEGRKIALCHGTGSRTSEQIIEYGRALAEVYDQVLVTDFDPRGRPRGETSELVSQGLLQAGFTKENIIIIPDPGSAVEHLFSLAGDGDLLIIQPDEVEPVIEIIMEKYRTIFENKRN